MFDDDESWMQESRYSNGLPRRTLEGFTTKEAMGRRLMRLTSDYYVTIHWSSKSSLNGPKRQSH